MKTFINIIALGILLSFASFSFVLDDCTGSDCLGALGLTIETQDTYEMVSSGPT
ncbi:MAG: hypothetical protein N838_10755 [Thiohalocapsa sp. PB-PSB1]|jgi:hypothetical protein|nr:MAG: hypothetical protein N838_22140 [Thiohalocapsa sp. PB-PSB1]QQO53763.1 MAG: hypothetical protein N838_10755 [Thiohalocapsa sp. PB-PSB1]